MRAQYRSGTKRPASAMGSRFHQGKAASAAAAKQTANCPSSMDLTKNTAFSCPWPGVNKPRKKRRLAVLPNLKNTHRSTTESSVYTYPKTFFMRVFLMRSEIRLPSIFSINSKSPCPSPHTTKLTSAPCHKPVTKNTMNKLMFRRAFPFRLPPSGMYR